MNAVNPVQLLLLVWTLSAVCRADDDISVTCEDVSGSVGEEVTFTCSVSLKSSNCCVEMYKFKKYNDSEICRQDLKSCEQRNSFTCRFTPTTAMTEQFRFFVQTTCGRKPSEFTVNVAAPSKAETVNENHHKETPSPTGKASEVIAEENTRSNGAVFAAVAGCFFIIIITVIYKRKPNLIKTSELWMFLSQTQAQRTQHENNIPDSEV